MIYLGADGYLYDTNDFRNTGRNFTILDEVGTGYFPYDQTIEVVGQRDITPDLAAEYARQLQLSQERGQIIGYTPTGEPIYQTFIGGDPTAEVGEQTMGTVVTTGSPTQEETQDTGLQTGASGFLGGTPIGTGTTGIGEGAGTGATDAGTNAGAGGTGTDTGTGGTGMGTGTTGGGLLGDGAGTVVGAGGTDTVVGAGGTDTVSGGTDTVVGAGTDTVSGGDSIVDMIPDVFTPDIVDPYTPEVVITPEGPVVLPPVVLPPVVQPPVTQPPVVQPPVVQPSITEVPQSNMMRYGGFNFFNTPLQSGFYSERGFEPGYLPFGPGYPTFRSGVSGYTPLTQTGFQFGVPEIMAPRVVFQPGVFDPGIIGEDGTWRPTPPAVPPGTTPPGSGTVPGFNEPD